MNANTDTTRNDGGLPRIASFEEFTKRWELFGKEQEQVSMLYAGTDVDPFADGNGQTSDEVKSMEIGKWIMFYLRESKNPNAKVAKTAQQLIVKSWLKRLQPWNMVYPGYLGAARQVLEFLQEPKEALFNPPHPHFVYEWLSSIQKERECGSRPSYRGEDDACNALNSAEGFDKLITGALCAWKCGYLLARNPANAGAIPHIKEFLGKRGYDVGKVFLGTLCNTEPPTKLGSRDDEHDANRIAACALLKLLYLNDPNFPAKFADCVK